MPSIQYSFLIALIILRSIPDHVDGQIRSEGRSNFWSLVSGILWDLIAASIIALATAYFTRMLP